MLSLEPETNVIFNNEKNALVYQEFAAGAGPFILHPNIQKQSKGRREKKAGKRYIQTAENTGPHKNLHTAVHSSLIHNGQKVEDTQMATNRWMNRQNVVLTEEYYSAMKKGEATAWMDLDHVMLSERSQTQKAGVCDSI